MGKIGTAICDANVLIDLANAECDLIGEVVAYYGALYVPDIVFREVHNLDDREAERLVLTIMDTPAVLERIPGLSPQDSACLHLVVENGWACIANDKKLRKECLKAGRPVFWGLETVLLLVEAKLITKKRAETTARKIKESNFEMDDGILTDFIKKLGQL